MRLVNEKAIKLIQNFEKLKLKPYIPVKGDRPTIGWGSTFYPDGTPVKLTDPPITKEFADEMFSHDISKFSNALEKFITENNITLNDNQFGALVSFFYNLGSGILTDGIPDSITKGLLARDPQAVGKGMLLYNKSGGRVLQGLVNRRKVERDLFLS